MKFFLLMIAIAETFASDINWCEMQAKYCSGRKHIMCQPKSFPMAKNVRNIQMVKMTPEIIEAGVNRHNFHRSNIASGRVRGIPSARAMQKMSWHVDLANVAAEHARHANFMHDECRGFTEFPWSGQNLAIILSTEPFTNLTQNFVSLIDNLYNEMPIVRDRKLSCIYSYTTFRPSCRDAGHFTVMVKDVNGHVGCALVTFETYENRRWWYALMATCNYADNNIINQKIYAKGPPCSGCASVGKQCERANSLCI